MLNAVRRYIINKCIAIKSHCKLSSETLLAFSRLIYECLLSPFCNSGAEVVAQNAYAISTIASMDDNERQQLIGFVKDNLTIKFIDLKYIGLQLLGLIIVDTELDLRHTLITESYIIDSLFENICGSDIDNCSQSIDILLLLCKEKSFYQNDYHSSSIEIILDALASFMKFHEIEMIRKCTQLLTVIFECENIIDSFEYESFLYKIKSVYSINNTMIDVCKYCMNLSQEDVINSLVLFLIYMKCLNHHNSYDHGDFCDPLDLIEILTDILQLLSPDYLWADMDLDDIQSDKCAQLNPKITIASMLYAALYEMTVSILLLKSKINLDMNEIITKDRCEIDNSIDILSDRILNILIKYFLSNYRIYSLILPLTVCQTFINSLNNLLSLNAATRSVLAKLVLKEGIFEDILAKKCSNFADKEFRKDSCSFISFIIDMNQKNGNNEILWRSEDIYDLLYKNSSNISSFRYILKYFYSIHQVQINHENLQQHFGHIQNYFIKIIKSQSDLFIGDIMQLIYNFTENPDLLSKSNLIELASITRLILLYLSSVGLLQIELVKYATQIIINLIKIKKAIIGHLDLKTLITISDNYLLSLSYKDYSYLNHEQRDDYLIVQKNIMKLLFIAKLLLANSLPNNMIFAVKISKNCIYDLLHNMAHKTQMTDLEAMTMNLFIFLLLQDLMLRKKQNASQASQAEMASQIYAPLFTVDACEITKVKFSPQSGESEKEGTSNFLNQIKQRIGKILESSVDKCSNKSDSNNSFQALLRNNNHLFERLYGCGAIASNSLDNAESNMVGSANCESMSISDQDSASIMFSD
ncbi:MAG: hypothetical protein MHMPM18_001658 [Marteilia pararefringens]